VGGKDDERAPDTCVLRACDDLIEILGELRPGDMTVTVDEQGLGLWTLGSGHSVPRYRTREPGGIAGSTATRFGNPPSVLAANPIPFDSIPINFAGFRFATMAIVRPTS